jgi:hypothetical protein
MFFKEVTLSIELVFMCLLWTADIFEEELELS